MTQRFFPAVVLAIIIAAAASAADAADVELPNPLRNVAAGQWVRYRVNTLFGTAEQKQTVVAVTGGGDEAVITIRTEVSLDGEVMDEREEATTYRKLLDEQAAALDGAENRSSAGTEAEIGGATFDAVAVSYTQDGQKYTLLLSGDVPLAGVVRLVAEGAEEPVVELIDFGG